MDKNKTALMKTISIKYNILLTVYLVTVGLDFKRKNFIQIWQKQRLKQ